MSPDSSSVELPFKFLELTLISAQDLFPSSRSLQTYAVSYLHPSHRLRTRLDSSGHTSPSWNDKFLLPLDDSTLLSDTSALQINIFAARPRFLPAPDTLLGSSRAILSTLHLSPSTRLFALQIRRPSSLRPHGILNIALALALAADPSSFPPLPLPPPVFDRSGSAGPPSGDKETALLERKLKKWRSEIRAPEDDRMGWEKAGDAAADHDGPPRKAKPARPRAMSCFNLAGHYADQMEEDDDHSNSSASSWSSTSLR